MIYRGFGSLLLSLLAAESEEQLDYPQSVGVVGHYSLRVLVESSYGTGKSLGQIVQTLFREPIRSLICGNTFSRRHLEDVENRVVDLIDFCRGLC
jgi:predicted GTPase